MGWQGVWAGTEGGSWTTGHQVQAQVVAVHWKLGVLGNLDLVGHHTGLVGTTPHMDPLGSNSWGRGTCILLDTAVDFAGTKDSTAAAALWSLALLAETDQPRLVCGRLVEVCQRSW